MGELPPNYNNRDQLPLYGLLYNAEKKEYEYTIGGVAVAAASRPSGEEAKKSYEVTYAKEYVWLGVQPTAEQAPATT